MSEGKSAGARPLKVCVKPGSKAELMSRRLAAKAKVAAKAPPQVELIAHGFHPRPDLNLIDRGGKIIQHLTYTNFFVGGSASWESQDRTNIDKSLSAAMSDSGLNNVLLQYFRGAPAISSTFIPSTVLEMSKPQSVSQADVEQLLTSLHSTGKLPNANDFGNTLFNFMLPRGTVLTIDDGGGDKKTPGHAHSLGGEVEEKASSLEGLGGFHGSIHIGGIKLYYAVGVFSEGSNGIVAFNEPWKNVVATFYHELVEARTDADVEDNRVAWVNDETPGEEIGDIPMTLAGANLGQVMKEVPLSNGSGLTVPIQLMWSNAVGGPEGPIAHPH